MGSGAPARGAAVGAVAWIAAGGPLVAQRPHGIEPGLPAPSVWVTRARPKIDRIACPWLVRRFVDPLAIFHFVTAEWVKDVAEEIGGIPYDIKDVHYSHRGDECTFDTMLQEFGLTDPALLHLARIVRGADTARPDLEPQGAGLLAISLGLSALSASRTRVESLFVDEGFSSLDPDTLEVALSAFESQRASGRQIGVISHVPALADRIGAQVRVVPLGGGRSKVEVRAM